MASISADGNNNNFDLQSLGITGMLQHWYQYVILGVLGLSSLAAIGYVVYLISRVIYKSAKRKGSKVTTADPKVKQFFRDLSASTPRFKTQRAMGKPRTFGVYFGTVSDTPTVDELRVLQQWDMLVVDPFQPGVTDGLQSLETTPAFVIGRIDVATMLTATVETDKISRSKVIVDLILQHVHTVESPYNGILLANWDEMIPTETLNELIAFLNILNMNVYNEITGPRWMDSQNSSIAIDQLAGVVFINGAITRFGERRDYMQLIPMKKALEAATGQSCLREFAVGMCDIVDDDAVLPNAVVKRSFTWCGYYGAIPWVGRTAALTDATQNHAVICPDGAFDWLKRDKVVDIHETWRLNCSISNDATEKTAFAPLEPFLPGISTALDLYPVDYSSTAEDVEQIVDVQHFNWVSKVVFRTVDPLSTSSHGIDYSGLGCFPIGMHVSQHDFDTVLRSQTRLLKLNLLQKIEHDELKTLGHRIKNLVDKDATWSNSPNDLAIVQRLIDSLIEEPKADTPPALNVYVGLDTGFRSTDLNSSFWGVYDGDNDTIRLFIARKAKDLAGTVLHTYMSSMRCTRAKCFEAEYALAQGLGQISDATLLPQRMLQDLDMLSPAEMLSFLQGLAISGSNDFLFAKIRECAEYRLIQVSSSVQLRKTNTVTYLAGDISPEDLIAQRLQWYRQQKIEWLPRHDQAVEFFKTVDRVIESGLRIKNKAEANTLVAVLENVIRPGKIDIRADLVALAVFCSMRRFAFEEIYLDVTDRNPIFNDQPDQAAIFAELFGLGSKTEAYLDVTPKAFGKVLYDNYRTIYQHNQPPVEADDGSLGLATTYSSANPDMDRDGLTGEKKGFTSKLRNTSYIGVFAIPALIDILLLTTTGRGLYLSAHMGNIAQEMATYALILALVISGGVSAWIGCGGSYYLFARVYPTMNMFMVTRMIGGITLVTLMAICGFVAIVIERGLNVGVGQGFFAAAIFILYLFVLTSYLFVLAVLSNLQFPGSPLPSGRTAIGQSLIILILSPILAKVTESHDDDGDIVYQDVIIYPVVLVVFCSILFIRARQVMAAWNTWLLDIPSNTDQQVLDWYIKTHHNGDKDVGFKGLTGPAAMQLSRTALYDAVKKERTKPFWTKPTSDEIVVKLAKAFPTTVFILEWYSGCIGASAKPLPYSSTWNLQINVAINALRINDKGLRLHNAFNHWRYACTEIACGVMYFVLALLDRWIELVCGGQLIGIAIQGNNGARLAIGFSLVYYLFSAFILDFQVAPLFALVNKGSDLRIQSAVHLNEVAKKDALIKRKLYWGTIVKFLGLHLWGLAICSALIWSYVANLEATFLFLAYAFSYAGLLWFQYNRVYALDSTTGPLSVAIFIGLAIGIPLRKMHPDIFWNDVLPLGIATWSAALLTFRAVDLSPHKFQELEEPKPFVAPPHTQKAIGPHSDVSNERLSELFDELEKLPKADVLVIKNPTALAAEVLQILTSAKHASKAIEVKGAFPHAFDLLNHIIVGWDTGEVVVHGVSLAHLVGQKQDICAVSRKVDRRLKIYVGMDLRGSSDWMNNFNSNARAIAEAIVHETCEVGLGLSHSDAVLAELLVSSTEELRLPLRVQRQLEASSTRELLEILNARDQELVRHLGLQTNFDHDWDILPYDVKVMLVKRVCGETYEINETQLKWIESKCGNRTPYLVYLARRDLNTCLALLIDEYTSTLLRDPAQKTVPTRRESVNNIVQEVEIGVAPHKSRVQFIKGPYRRIARIGRNFIKFLVVALIAEPEFQRELAYLLTGNPFRRIFVFILTRLWAYSRFIQDLLLPFFMFSGRPHVQKLAKLMKKGTLTTMQSNRLLIDNLKAPSTAFIDVQRDGAVKLWQYSGVHTKKPDSDWQLISINLYSKTLAITRRQEFAKGQMVNDYVYEYSPVGASKLRKARRTPASRYCVAGKLEGEVIQYSRKGFIKSGTATRDGIPYEFTYEYRRKAKFDDDLLRVKYVFNPRTLSPLTVNVWWCVPPVRHAEEQDRWIPFSRVTHAQFVQNGDIYETKWAYDHKCHPTLSTLLNGEEAKTPDMIIHDHLSVLTKPASTSFVDEDPLLPFNSTHAGFFSRLLGLHKKTIPVSTSRSRAFLWKSWKDSTQFDGVTARWLDELALRSDPVLKPYWSARDAGNIHNAIKYLRVNGDAIMASVDMDHEVSAWTSLAFKMSDFFSMGQGGDTSINTRTTTSQINDSHEQLHVLATDTGTYPCEGGGVSCCRRDMVNNLQYIKWHIVAETANDYGIPRFQIEQNIQSLKILPLWGLDFLTPTHGIIENQLDTAMDEKLIDTSNRDIREKFLPILVSLVRGARALKFTQSNVEEFTKALVSLNTYFETRNWGAVWRSPIVKIKWRELWLSGTMENTRPIQDWFNVERPTVPDLDCSLDLYSRYLFIFSLPVPEQVPTVFQATHHSIGAAYGIVCKIKRHCTFQIWDHAISWREINMYLSSSQCSFPPFVRISLVGLMRFAAHLNMYHADVVLPCTSYFNPGWEIELGSCEGTLIHRKKFSRKLDPVVNGICNMQSFTPVTEIRTEIPTVTMLSHVQFTKDVKTALLAADVIVNHWGFKDYKLDVYGSLDRTPTYTVECQELIASKSLREFVSLKGYGNPAQVFGDTWVFLNSSLSEGLPLAIGEAALTGAPIVCTDVGATFQVVTDPDQPKKRYGAVVPPNDPWALARAQIAMLAVMDEWEEYGEDTEPFGPTPDFFTPADVARITQRMYDKRPQRQKVGSQLRSIVQKSFSGDRYLREHEQMLWLGKHRNEIRREALAAQNNEKVIEMLDDVYTGLEMREYRPEFLRHVSGFSAFNSATSELNRSTVSERTASYFDDGQSRYKWLEKGLRSPTRPWHLSSSDEDSEKGKERFAEMMVDSFESDSEGTQKGSC